ncbi:MAG: FkbM family methyltransferase [Sedimentisphaerales bacterium]
MSTGNKGISEFLINDYNLDLLETVTPSGEAFSMYVTPRFAQSYAHEYENFSTRIVKNFVKKCDLFVDVGANYGYYSLLAADANKDIKIIAVEPIEENFKVLNKNLIYNNIGTERAKCINAAVSSIQGKIKFYKSEASDNSSVLPHPNSKTLEQLEVSSVSLDDVLKEEQYKSLFIKTDTEGSELEVLKGLSATFEKCNDITILLEMNPKLFKLAGTSCKEVLEFLSSKGFKVFGIDDQDSKYYPLDLQDNLLRMQETSSYFNVLCIKKDVALSVCLFSHSSQLAGAERSLADLVQDLSEQCVLCSVILPNDGPLKNLLLNAGASVHILNVVLDSFQWAIPHNNTASFSTAKDNFIKSMSSITIQAINYLKRLCPDVIYSQTMVIPWGGLCAEILSIPHAWSVCEYGELDHEYKFYYSFPESIKALYESSDIIFCITRSVRDEVFKGLAVSEDRLPVVYRKINIEVDTDNVKSEEKFDYATKQKCKIGIFGTIYKGKGQEDLVKAGIKLLEDGYKIKLYFYGHKDSTYSANLSSLIKSSGFEDAFVMSDFLNNPYDKMKEMDIIVSCSRNEAMGRTLIEAALLEKPIIYADSGGPKEIFVNHEHGLAYEPGNYLDLADKILATINDPSPTAYRINKALEHVQNIFTAENYSKKIEYYLRKIKSEKRDRLRNGILALLNDGSFSEIDDRSNYLLKCYQENYSALCVQLQAEQAKANDLALKLSNEQAKSESLVKQFQQKDAEQERKNVSFNQAVAERDAQNASLNRAMADLKGKVNSLNQVILERDGQIAGFNQVATERDVQNASLNKVIADLDKKVDGLKRIVVERDEQIAGLNQVVAERDVQNAGLNQAMTDLKGKVNSLNQVILERNEEIAAISNRLFQIESTLTWYVAIKIWRTVQAITPRFFSNAIKRVAQHHRQASNRIKTGHYSQDTRFNPSNNPNLPRFLADKHRLGRILRPMFVPIRLTVRTVRSIFNLFPGYRTMRSLRILRRSCLFDIQYYLANNRNVMENGVDPLYHYLKRGWKEHLNPSPLFNTDWYLQQNSDVSAAGINPLLHFIEYGAAEGRAPQPLPSTQNQEAQRHSFETVKAQAMLLSTATARPRQHRRPPEPLAQHSTVYAFTSICLNYLPKALVLAETLKHHNPHVRFCLLVNEPIPAGLLDSFDIFDEVATIDDLDIPDKQAWLFGHSVIELCTAVKGFFMLNLLERPECATAFYFDPDIAVFSSIDVLLNPLKDSSILLTPHQTEPEENIETIMDNEICSLKHGVYNLGFLGVKSSAEGLRFARWWRDRLHRFCRADIPAGLFTDQRWIDLVPAFFTDFHILRHPGCNVCTWNLTHRRIEGNLSDGFTVNGQPLIFYHFSGFDSGAQEIMLNKYGKHMPAACVLRQWYLSRTERPEDKVFSNRQWKYNYFTNGEPITPEQRRLFRDRIDIQQAFPDPFAVEGPGTSFYLWYQVEILGQRRTEQLRYEPGSGGDTNLEQLLTKQNAAALPENHPFDANRSIIQWAAAKGPVILFVGHFGDGGVEKHMCELARHIGDRARVLMMTPKLDGSVMITAMSAEKRVTVVFDPLRQFDKLVDFLTACNLSRVHIHHEFGNEHYLERLVRRLAKPFDFTVHDYYTLAPIPQLIGPDNRFVGEDLAANSNRLLVMSVCSKRPTSLIAWQNAHRWLLTDAARVIAPSHDVARRLMVNMPALNPIIAAHPEKRVPHQPIHIEKIDTHTHLRIAVLGQISPHKGYEVIRKCARLAQKNNYPLSFDVIGQPIADADALARAGVRISGPYSDRVLQTLIRERRPHLIWYPALWPESYSYTLSAGFEACLPIAVPNLGAFPERVVGRRWSWVCSWDLAPNDWVAFFMHIREAHFLARVEPECSVGMPPNGDNFYEYEYLSWCVAPSGESILAKVNAGVIQKGQSK